MIPLYTLLLSALAGVRWSLGRRAARTERKYVSAAHQAEAVARKLPVKPGNANADQYAAAKSQYELGRLVEARDGLEAKYLAQQSRADEVGRALAKLRGLKGRLVPYLFGVVDVALVLTALHLLGFPHELTGENVNEWVRSLRG